MHQSLQWFESINWDDRPESWEVWQNLSRSDVVDVECVGLATFLSAALGNLEQTARTQTAALSKTLLS